MRLLSLLFLVTAAVAQDCNICGDGNSIQYPQGVVEFVYQGVKRKNNCQRWQDIVKNPNAISDEFCRGEMLRYTLDKCRCTDPEGRAVKDYWEFDDTTNTNPTGPSPTLAPTKFDCVERDGQVVCGGPKAIGQAGEPCNICGFGNFMAWPTGTVTFEINGERRSAQCNSLQNSIRFGQAPDISDEYCRNELLQYTAEPCQCENDLGEKLTDIMDFPTPAPGSDGDITSVEKCSTVANGTPCGDTTSAGRKAVVATAIVVLVAAMV